MSSAATVAWKQQNREYVRAQNRNYMRRKRMSAINANIHMARAFAERMGVPVKAVGVIGTLQLCLCRSDEARRILLRAAQ